MSDHGKLLVDLLLNKLNTGGNISFRMYMIKIPKAAKGVSWINSSRD
jgi:hypothetical protein